MIEMKKAAILVIDDEADVRETLRTYIERQGYPALMASNGEEGLKMVAENNIGIIFCDIVMPKMDGIEFLRRVHKIDPKVQVIMVTGKPSTVNCMESIEHNVCEYLIKPVPREEILASIIRAERNINEKYQMLERGLRKVKPTEFSAN